MNLKTKMVLGSVSSILLTFALLSSVFIVDKGLLQSSYDESRQKGLNIAHLAFLANTKATLENQQVLITRNRKLKKAIKKSDAEGVASEVVPIINRLSAAGQLSDIFVVDKEFKILFASDRTLIGQSIDSVLLASAMKEVKTYSGLELNPGGKVGVNTIIPINSRGKVLGGVIMVRYYSEMLDQIKASVQGEIALYTLNNDTAFNATDDNLFSYVPFGSHLQAEEVAVDAEFYEAIGIDLLTNQGKSIAHLVAMVNATEKVVENKLYYQLGLAGVIIWLLFVIFVTYFFAGRSFKPLDEMVSVAREIQQTGNMALRIHVTSQDEIGDAATAVNKTLDAVAKTINDANVTLNQVAQGDFSVRMNSQAHGDLKTLETAVNESVSSLDVTMQAIIKVVKGIDAGDFSVRMDSAVADNIKQPVDQAMGTISRVISEINMALSNLAKGDFSKKVAVQTRGELKVLSDNVNSSIEQTALALDAILQVVSALSHGDLTKKVNGQFTGQFGEVGDALNTSLTNVSGLISETNIGIHNLVDNVNQIHQGSQDLNDRTQTQAASLEETTATMVHITDAVKQTTDNARAANALATTARTQADDGAKVMRSTIESMGDIREASHKIEEIITLIDSIAFQTNLLALNAAVEAARAGEHGRGFAVVAGEVRNLAGKSADAARDIKGLIENAVSAVEQGTERAERSDQALKTITEGIRKVSDIVAEITAASVEQSTSISQIGVAINEIDTATQQNAALVEESSAASESMKEEARMLGELVSKFKV